MAYPTTDFVYITDSWGAGWQRGTTLPSLTMALTAPLTGAFSFQFYNTAEWWSPNLDPGSPTLIVGTLMQGSRGFSSTLGKGSLADAIVEAGGGAFDISKLNIHEYGLAATTAGIHDYGGSSYTSSSGAYGVGVPTGQEIPAAPGTGLTYGCPSGSVGAGGWKLTSRSTAWLTKQRWLASPGGLAPPGDPMLAYKDYTLCDMIQNPPTGRLVVFVCLSGNDALDMMHRYLLVDPYTGTFDPTGNLQAVWNEVYDPATNTGSMRTIADTIYMLNPNAEIVWVSYMNFAVDDPNIPNPKIVLPDGTGGQHSLAAQGGSLDGPTGWKQFFDEGANTLDAAYQAPNHNPTTMQPGYWPLGANGVTFGGTWTPGHDNFHRYYWLWLHWLRHKSDGTAINFFRDWLAHWMADSFASQRIRGGCSYYGCWNWNFNNWIWGIWNIYFTGYRWNTIYGHVRAVYADVATIQNWIGLGNVNPVTYAKWQTVMAKDITTANVAKCLRDFQKPRGAAAQSYYRGQNKRFIYLDLWDKAPETVPPGTWVQSGTSQDDPSGVPTLPKSDFIDLHLQESGNTKWCKLIAEYFLAATDVFGDFPVAQDDFITTQTNTPVTFGPTVNDEWGAGGVNVGGLALWNGTVFTTGPVVVAGVGTWTMTGLNVTFTPETGYTGATTILYRITNNNAKTATATIHMNVGLPPQCPAITAYTGRVGDVFGEALAALYGINYTVVGGLLPPGLCLDTTGLIVGCPTTAGSYAATIHITNGGSPYIDCEITFIIAARPSTPTRETGRGNSGSDTGWALAVRPNGQLIVVGPAHTSTVLANE